MKKDYNNFLSDNTDAKEYWEKEWQDMPEFVQEDKTSIKSVVVHFETEKDMEEFSKLVGRNVTMETVGFYFPVKEEPKTVYVDES